MAENVFYSQSLVTKAEREQRLKQKGCILWFTGLSGSGKSTVARALERRLVHEGYCAYILDGDNIRHGLNKDLGFSREDRIENLRRIGEVSTLFADAGILCLTAFISPYREDRAKVRMLMEPGRFFEIFINAPLTVCEERDPKGLYKKARAGEIHHFTGIDDPYEAPEEAELTIETDHFSVDDCVNQIINRLQQEKIIGLCKKNTH